MADKSFGVKELNLLNASGTPTVTSPNNLNLNANTVAISTSCTIGNNLTVTSTTNSVNLNVTGIGTLTRGFATDLSVSGISTISQPSNANPHSLWDVVNNGSSAYRFTGPGQDGAEDNPNIYLVRGQRYVFKMNASGHPFQIRVANGGAAYSDGVTNNGAQTGNVVFNVQHDAPAQLYYQCTSHGGMVGNIYIVGGPQVISGVVTATTFVGNLTGNVTGNATGLSGTPNVSAGTIAGSTGTFTGDLTIPDKIVHAGDTDTAIRFSGADTVSVEVAGSEKIRVDNTYGLRILSQIYMTDSVPLYLGNSNDLTLLHDGTDCRIRFNHTVGDLKFQNNSNTNLMVLDASGRLGIGAVPTAQYAHNLIQIGNQATLGANAALSATGQTFLTHNLYFDTGGTLKVFNTSNANEGAIFRLVDGQLLFSNSAATTGTPTVTERLRIDSSGRLIQRYSAAPYNNRAATFQAPAGQTSTYIAVINTETNGASGILFGDHAGQNAGNFDGYINYSHQYQHMQFLVGSGTERLRIASNGTVSVKTGGINLENATATSSRAYSITNAAGTTGWTFGNGVTASSHQFVIYDNTAGAARLTIDSDGKIGHNKAASGCTFDVEPVNNTHAMRANGQQAGYATLICDNRASSGTRHYISFRISNGVTGKITSTGSSTVYATSSDYRLKENVTAISDGISRLKTLKPSRFNWKADSSTTVDGFLAHEVTAVPEAVVGTKDEVDSDNNPVYQAIDEGKLVPLITAALKEAIAEIETLKTKVAALEGS